MVQVEGISRTTAVEQSSEHLATEVDGETVLLHVESGTYYGFNRVATELWRRTEDGTTVGELQEYLEAEYDDEDPERLREDLENVLEDMAEKDLVEIAE